MIPEHVVHEHRYAPGLGGVTIKVERNTRGTTYEVNVNRPRRDGESEDEAREAALAQVDAVMRELDARYGPAAAP